MKRHCIFVGFWIYLTIVFLFSPSIAAEGKYGGTLRIGTLVPQHAMLDGRYGTVSSFSTACMMIYDGLLQWTEDLADIKGWLATDWDTKDNKVWEFRIREGVKFHNGRELTAEDIKANFDWIIETPKGWKPSRYTGTFSIQKVEVIDKYAVKITLEYPFGPFPEMIATLLQMIVPMEEIEKWGDEFTFHPVGTGPFRAVEIKEDRVVFERFDDYWGPKPYLDRLEYVFIRSGETRLMALQKGEIDLCYLSDEARPLIDKDPNLQYTTLHVLESLIKLGFNVRRWPMNDIRFRKAVWMGADWVNMSRNAYPYQSGRPSRTLFEHSAYFNPEALELVPAYDPKEAKKLIQAVEKDAGKKIPALYWLDNDGADRKAMAEMAKIQLAQIGVPIDIHLLPRQLLPEKLQRDPKVEWDLAQNGIGFGLEPYRGLAWFITDSGYAGDGKSLLGNSNPEMDNWIRKALETLDKEERIKCYQEAEKCLLREALLIPWGQHHYILARDKKVKGININHQAGIIVTRDWVNAWIEN